ncbi:MAG: hypothetical protein V1916_03330, partial [Patescibacteria group bacterium]
MRRTKYALVISLAAVLAVSFPIATLASQTSDLVMTREVFVHYPHGAAVKPSAGGPTNTSCPNADTCADYKLTKLAWPQSTATSGIHYTIDSANSNLGSGEVASAISASFATWTTASKSDSDEQSISFIPDGVSTVPNPNISDNKNSLTWRNLSSSYPNAIAVTFAWYHRGSNVIIEADTIFN